MRLHGENFNNDIIRGLQRRNPDLDMVQYGIQAYEVDDPTVLEWAASQGRVVFLTTFKPMVTSPTSVSNRRPMPGLRG
jgi:hypothetical protein